MILFLDTIVLYKQMNERHLHIRILKKCTTKSDGHFGYFDKWQLIRQKCKKS